MPRHQPSGEVRKPPGGLRQSPPQDAAAHLNRGNTAAAAHCFDEAIAHFETAIALDPSFAAAHNNRGVVFGALGRLEAAIDAYRPAIALKPDYAEAHFNLGNALAALHRHEEAIASYRNAAAIRPYPEAHYNCGNAWHALRRYGEAVDQFRQALALRPAYPEAHNNLGNAFYSLGRHREALAHYERACALQPASAEAHTNIGNALQALNRHGESIPWFEKAITLKAGYADPYTNLGNVLMELGRLDEARHAFETAIEIAPHRAKLYRNLIDCKQFTHDDPHLAAMQDLLREAPNLITEEQIDLLFALGKALADSGQHDTAFRHIIEGNALKRGLITYDEATALGFLTGLPAWFTGELIGARQGLGDPSPTPTFVFGMPRSGTTLVEQILASHPKVFGAGELSTFENAVVRVATEDLGLAPGAGADFGLSDDTLRKLGALYVNEIRAMAPTADRITDKMPANFRYAGLIHLALPNARMIHVRRNPVDTCLSCFMRLFEGDQPFVYDLGEVGRHYRAYAALMDHWHRVLPPDVLLEVRYEDVVADLEGQARRIIAHSGLDWDPTCLAFHATDRPVRTASATQVRQPIYRTSIGRWRPYAAMLRPLLEALGPDLAGPAFDALVEPKPTL